MLTRLSSGQNGRVKAVVKLREKRERDKTGLFLIEGYREMKRAVDGGVRFESVFVSPGLFLGENEWSLVDKVKAEVFEVPKALFEKMAYRDRPDGLLGVAHQMGRGLEDVPVEEGIYVVAEAIEKPGNLGTILRSSDAAGVKGVIVCDRCTDIYNPNVVRASVGTLFTLPVVEAGSEETIAWLKRHKVQIVAATPAAERVFTDAPLGGSVAIVVGCEQLGLTRQWLESADICVKIPMLGVADSLNVAMATTLLLYEAVRQR